MLPIRVHSIGQGRDCWRSLDTLGDELAELSAAGWLAVAVRARRPLGWALEEQTIGLSPGGFTAQRHTKRTTPMLEHDTAVDVWHECP